MRTLGEKIEKLIFGALWWGIDYDQYGKRLVKPATAAAFLAVGLHFYNAPQSPVNNFVPSPSISQDFTGNLLSSSLQDLERREEKAQTDQMARALLNQVF